MTAHRYWRITLNTSASNAYGFSEIQFRTTAGVSLPFSGGTASAAEIYSGTYDAAKATDGNTSTLYSSVGTTQPQWWAYDYGAGNSKDIVEIAITARSDASYTQAPTSFTPQWSDDGTAWTSMTTIPAAWTSSGQVQVFAVEVISTSSSYANPGGSGSRPYIVVTTSASFNGTISALVNGTQANEFWFAAGQSGHEVRFAFPVPRNITEARWYQDNASTHGDWKWQGSSNGTTWTDIGGTFTLGGALQTITTLSANTNFWQYYRMLQMAGVTSSSPYLREIEFKIDDTVPVIAMLTQISIEQWGILNPDVQLTQMAIEQWGSVASLRPPSFSARHV